MQCGLHIPSYCMYVYCSVRPAREIEFVLYVPSGRKYLRFILQLLSTTVAVYTRWIYCSEYIYYIAVYKYTHVCLSLFWARKSVDLKRIEVFYTVLFYGRKSKFSVKKNRNVKYLYVSSIYLMMILYQCNIFSVSL